MPRVLLVCALEYRVHRACFAVKPALDRKKKKKSRHLCASAGFAARIQRLSAADIPAAVLCRRHVIYKKESFRDIPLFRAHGFAPRPSNHSLLCCLREPLLYDHF